MFWKRSKRVSRRQRVLEELLWLDPVDRERRAIAAVAAGDFGADEVDAVLRLVARLDSVRDMSPPARGQLLPSVPAAGYRVVEPTDAVESLDGYSTVTSGAEFEPELVVGSRRDAEAAVVAQAAALAEATTGGSHLEPHHQARGGRPAGEAGAIPIEREPLAVPVEAETLAVPVESDPAGPPVDALEAAERWIAGAPSNGGSAPAHSHPRGARKAAAEPPTTAPSEASMPEASEGEASGTADEAWPTIAWLRPS